MPARSRTAASAARALWEEAFARWAEANPSRRALLDRLAARALPAGWAAALPAFVARRRADGHQVGLRQGPERAGARSARALGRLGRPGRQQRHDDGRGAVVHPGRAPDQDVPRQPVRPDAALRHPRVRHGRDPERDHPARPDQALRRHLPGLQRLHAPRRPDGRADGDPGHLRLDARLDRARRGRPDAPAGRAALGAARDPGPRRGAAGGRERDVGRVADRTRAHRPPGRLLPDQAEASGAGPEPRSPARMVRLGAGTCWPRRQAGRRT